MAPDLNSLPPSRSSTSSPLQQRNLPSSTMEGQNNNNNGTSQTASPRSSSAAPMNNNHNNTTDLSHRSSLSGHRSSPHSSRPSISESRRRSGIGMHLNLNEPPGEAREHRSSSFSNYFRTASPGSLGGSPIIGTGDPHHQRAPSLGELHQELEQEQEAQVTHAFKLTPLKNRLLQMIRQQQLQLHQLHQQQQHQHGQAAVIDDTTPSSERSQSFPSIPPLPTPGSRSMQIPLSHSHRRGSRASEAASPNLAATSTQHTPAIDPAHSSFSSDWSVLATNDPGAVPTTTARRNSRDESAFYQAEAAMLTRENQMLRMRIRELERQLTSLSSTENTTASTAASGSTNVGGEADAAVVSEGAEKT
ncbi:hypothetical protein BGW36DRAFT_354053 [Talaromyces proteolyticus]|uniref:Uncharacterized protein n=1 Tax=Talaromyces proteolyticus TaxID=1131652 RepID=A0AAD4Q1H5_9EURO|nr:uncharacterized protein BGW36DRAFT_354053 [Talaromyces proteolyticus]KAH8705655.1 hypothetical protein BGW36DRAFT_354053 [Talaromyces proteolyticus]